MSKQASSNCGRSVNSCAGFSLIELLVVLQIVILIIALAAPSLEAARGKSKQATCLSRLRNLGTASRIYQAADQAGQFLPVHRQQFTQCPGSLPGSLCRNPQFVAAYGWGGKSGIGRDFYLTGSSGDPLNSKYGSKAGFGPSTRPLNKILYPNGFASAFLGAGFSRVRGLADTQLPLDKYRCPADDGPPRGAHCQTWVNRPTRSSYDHFGTSYSLNKLTSSDAGGFSSETFSISPFLRPASRVPNPSRTIAYEENIGRFAWAAREDPCEFITGITPRPTHVIRGWHGKNWTFNHAFIDTHAERQTVYIEGTEDQDGFANHYRIEKVFEDPAMQNRFHCVIIRGDGWQLDTLPAPPIPMGITGGFGRSSYEDCVGEGFSAAQSVTDTLVQH